MEPKDAVLAYGAVLRLNRLVITDDLGAWLIREPAGRWANAATGRRKERRTALVSGLGCPFCIGFWLGAGVLVAHAATSRSPVARGAWRLTAASLALNYVAGHVSARLDA